LSLTCIVFFIGLLGIILNRKNILTIIMSIELLLLAVNLNFAAFSIYLDDISKLLCTKKRTKTLTTFFVNGR
jgi:NADH-quinone oxidoreductase subunit K